MFSEQIIQAVTVMSTHNLGRFAGFCLKSSAQMAVRPSFPDRQVL